MCTILPQIKVDNSNNHHHHNIIIRIRRRMVGGNVLKLYIEIYLSDFID